MSASAYPRLYYAGHFYWNPSTYNNDDYQSSEYAYPLQPYDPAAAEPTWDTFLASYDVNRANFQKWSVELFDLGASNGNQQKLAPPEWNFFGGNQCGFVTADTPQIETQYDFTKPTQTLTTGYTDLSGIYFDHRTSDDPWLQQSMQFNPRESPAKLVDVNPTVPWSSQVFADHFVLGTENNGFVAPVKQRMHSRWVGAHNLNQDGGLIIAGFLSAVFQTCFDKHDIEWKGGGGLQEAFHRALFEAPGHENIAGLMLRFISYDTMYFHGWLPPNNEQFPGMAKMQKLYARYYQELDEFEQGLREQRPAPPTNPAYSRVLGWLAPWYHDELVSMPGGRILLPIINANQPENLNEFTPVEVYSTGSGRQTRNFYFGPAAVERVIEGEQLRRVTIDLASTVLEIDSQGHFGQFGSLELGILRPGDKEPAILATLPDTGSSDYYQHYTDYAGLFDIDASGFNITLEEFDNSPLVLRANSYDYEGKQIVLTENPLVAQTDERGVYADEPENGSEGPTVAFSIQIRQFGRQPSEPVSLAVVQYGADWMAPVSGGSALAGLFYRNPTSGEFTPLHNNTLLDASSGNVEIGVRATHPGMPNITFYPVANPHAVTIPTYDNNNSAPFSWLFYNVVRVLPFDNQAAENFRFWLQENEPDVDLVNQRIFMELFLNFYLMYPVMQFISSPQKFQAWRGRIMQVVNPERFDSAAYMPVMRNLSSGQYQMLQLYNEYLNGATQGPLRKRRTQAPVAKR